MESGEQVKIRSNEVKQQYVERMAAYMQEVKMRCNQYKIDFVEADINKEFKQVLLPYLMKRMKLK